MAHGREGCPAQLCCVDQAMANLFRVEVLDKVTSDFDMPPAVAPEAPQFVQERGGADHGPPRQPVARIQLPRRRHLPLRHHPVGKAEHRHGNPGLGSESASNAPSAPSPARTPPSASRSIAKNWCRRAAHFQVGSGQGQRVRRYGGHHSGGAGGLHRLRPVRHACPVKNKHNQTSRRSTWWIRSRSAPSSGRTIASSLVFRVRPDAGSRPTRSRAPVAPAPVRVFGCLRRLRRNTLRQAAQPALWRPGDHRQCHRLLVDLWRQPAHHTVGQKPGWPRPGWSNSLFEDNAEFGFASA